MISIDWIVVITFSSVVFGMFVGISYFAQWVGTNFPFKVYIPCASQSKVALIMNSKTIYTEWFFFWLLEEY